ncbi:YfbU family protein [Loigolactobacillus coryniformis]|uniref:YfbU family protein n=1 Tax=Loigolactobacillus coryniformis TaxID=1610 RepID=UPI0002FF860F|nr:YfbU family protein [Loigolactobacillus coryniformis]
MGEIKLTPAERQILLNQYRIMRKMGIDDEFGDTKDDYEEKMAILENGYEYNYDKVVSTTESTSPDISKFVINLLDVYDACAFALEKDSSSKGNELSKRIENFGFDLNDSATINYYDYAKWFLNRGRFESLGKMLIKKNRGTKHNIDINTHGFQPSIAEYETCIKKYDQVAKRKSENHEEINPLALDEIEDILPE